MPITKTTKSCTLSEATYTTFNGTEFYKKYSKSPFLKTPKGKKFVLNILSSAIRIKRELKDKPSITLKGIKLVGETDLVVKKGSATQIIGDFEFTIKRLQGFCAAYACANVNKFDHNTLGALAASLGYELTPNSTEDFRKFYFSFTPGSEHFSCVLEFWPIVTTLVHLAIKKGEMKLKRTIKKFKVKSDDKQKLMYQLKDSGVAPRIVAVVAEKIDGEKINFSDCLKAFNYPI